VSADQNFLMAFKHFLQWLGKFWISWSVIMIDLFSKFHLLKVWRTLLFILFIIKYFEAVEKKKHDSKAEIFVACYISFSLAFPLNFSPSSREQVQMETSVAWYI
jgi:hypothetical protein